MLITHTSISLPVNTASPAIESLASESINKPQIPASNPTDQSSNSKNTTEFADQQRPNHHAGLTKDRALKEQPQSKQEGEESNQSIDDSRKEGTNLDLAEQKEVAKLQARDREVRAHEQAHASAGGSLAGSPNLSYSTGPDGKRYATSGEVSIDVSKVANDPKATIQKLEQVQKAALAPANPSSQDRKVAAQAVAGVNEAKAELTLKNIEKSRETELVTENKDDPKGEKTEQREGNISDDSLNPIRAKRESNALNEKLQNSGALNTEEAENILSLSA